MSDITIPEPTPVEPAPVEPQPLSRCGACGVTDDHPKHMIMVGYNTESTGGEMFHKDDDDRDGVIQYHFDCPTPWHSAVHAEFHNKLATLASSGIKGDELRARIVAGEI